MTLNVTINQRYHTKKQFAPVGRSQKVTKPPSAETRAFQQARGVSGERIKMTEKDNAELPEQKPKVGCWIYDSFYGGFYKCSVCGYTKGSKSDTCPGCGSDNRERKE